MRSITKSSKSWYFLHVFCLTFLGAHRNTHILAEIWSFVSTNNAPFCFKKNSSFNQEKYNNSHTSITICFSHLPSEFACWNVYFIMNRSHSGLFILRSIHICNVRYRFSWNKLYFSLFLCFTLWLIEIFSCNLFNFIIIDADIINYICHCFLHITWN